MNLNKIWTPEGYAYIQIYAKYDTDGIKKYLLTVEAFKCGIWHLELMGSEISNTLCSPSSDASPVVLHPHFPEKILSNGINLI